MKRRWTSVGGVVLVMVVLLSLVGAGATSSSLSGTRFKAGAPITFKVEDTTTWWWGCCAVSESLVLGWRIVDSTGLAVYSVVHDAPVAASLWQGTWLQMDAIGVSAAVGAYTLYVDTSVGTLSRCFTIYDPCTRCGWTPACRTCACNDVTSITQCASRTTLVFVSTSTSRCVSLFGWFGNNCSSPCNSCTTCP